MLEVEEILARKHGDLGCSLSFPKIIFTGRIPLSTGNITLHALKKECERDEIKDIMGI